MFKKQCGQIDGRLLALLIVVGIVAAFVAPWRGKLWLPPLASEHGAATDRLFVITLIVTSLVFVVVQGALAYIVFRYPHKEGRKALYFTEDHRMEALWTIVPAVIMAALIISGARLWAKIYSPPPADRFIVEVTGEQFKWAFRYPGKDGQFGRTNPKLISDENKLGVDPKDPASQDDIVINPGEGELHLPVGQPVEVLIRSKDVLHSFFLPHMRVKQDAVPGMTTRFWFTPTVTTKSKKNELKRQTQREYSLEELKRLVKSGTPFIADGTYKDKSGESIVEPETPLLEDAFTDLEKAGIQRMKAHQDFNFELYCAELCGLGHYQMFGVVVVEDDIDLYEWLSQQTPFSG